MEYNTRQQLVEGNWTVVPSNSMLGHLGHANIQISHIQLLRINDRLKLSFECDDLSDILSLRCWICINSWCRDQHITLPFFPEHGSRVSVDTIWFIDPLLRYFHTQIGTEIHFPSHLSCCKIRHGMVSEPHKMDTRLFPFYLPHTLSAFL